MSGLLATALAFYVYSPYLSLTAIRGGPVPPAESGSGPSSSRSVALPTASPSPARSPTAQASKDDAPPDPGRRQPGIRLVATVLAGGVFEVTETVLLPTPARTLTLTPPDLRGAGRDLRSADPVATDVVVRAAHQLVRPTRRTVRRATTLAFRRPTDRFEVRYRLHGTVRANRPSTAGRALGAVAPLVSRVPGDLAVAAVFRGEAVRNLRCAGLPISQQACFAGRRPNVRVNQTLAYRTALVLVQLDLRAPAREGRR